MSEEKKNITTAIFSAEENSAASIDKNKLGEYTDIAVRMFHTRVMGAKELALPAIAQFSSKMLSAVEVYRTLYFVNVLKIDMAYVTAILTLIGIYDVLNNPLMGMAYDKTRTRYGKSRPYILLGAVPYFLSAVILYSGGVFLGETSTHDPKKIIFVFVMLFVQETFSTIYSIPRNNITTLMSPNPKDRIMTGLLIQYIGEPGSQIIYTIIPPLMELHNKGYIKFPLSYVFMIISSVAAVFGVAGNLALALGSRERIMLQEKPAPLTKSLFYVLKNKYACRNFIANFATSWWANGGYSWDVVTQQEIFGGSIPSFIAYAPYNFLNTLSLAFIPKFQKIFKNNNKRAVIALRSWDLVSTICMTALGCTFVDKRWLIILIYGIFYGLDGMNNGPANVFEGELSREINDYTEYMTGERPDGTFQIITDLIMKVTSPISALLTIKLFNWTGYDTTIPMTPWSQGSKTIYRKVFFVFVGLKLLPNVISMIPYIFYDLEGEKRERMYIALNERRALIAQQKEQETSAELNELIHALEEEN